EAARCRLVDHGYRDPVPARGLPVLPDPCRRGPTCARSCIVARQYGRRSDADFYGRAGIRRRLRGKNSMTEKTLSHPENREPTAFTQEELAWRPGLERFPAEELTERHWAGLVDAARAKSPYFMLLARDPDILGARTRTDKDIFYNPEAGLPRPERELAATAASRLNGCIFCASVHARFASQFSKRKEDVQRLLDEGIGADLDERWN